MYDAGDNPAAVGATLSSRREPDTRPEKCAGGAGTIETGPASMRYVPSASKVPSARTNGRGNCPCPQPMTRSQVGSATVRQAPPPAQRPAASGAEVGAVELL